MRTFNKDLAKVMKECQPYMVGENWVDNLPEDLKAKFLKLSNDIDKQEKEERNRWEK